MIKQFFRQALTMMKQHKLFTGIYIAGTAVSIAIIMTLFIVIYINLGKIYPEYHRDEILLLDNEWHKYNTNGGPSNRSGYFNLDFVEAIKSESKHMKAIAVYDWNTSRIPHPITVDGNNVEVEEKVTFVSDGWWQVFDYKFIDGKGFTENEMRENVAVVSESLATQLFASSKVADREIKINGQYHRIVGVVKDATQCTPNSYGKIWLTIYNPFASLNTYAIHNDEKHFKIYTLAHDGEREMMLQEIENIFSRYYQPNEKEYNYELNILNYWQNALYLSKNESIWDALKTYFYIILAVFFIPALNLSGMIASRMNGRMVEVGVRRAYGATKQEIVSQVLWENMLLTLLGAIAGLLLSYAVVYNFSYRMTTFLYSHINYAAEEGNQLSAEMLLNPTIFLCALLMCALLNIASALMPTLFALRKNIIQSLYYKR
ncbi:MAG: ABC transporter permease [Bacteroidaceae bacterium]|nr:ABC transporter permease [Bacteroidaceae bacterium]